MFSKKLCRLISTKAVVPGALALFMAAPNAHAAGLAILDAHILGGWTGSSVNRDSNGTSFDSTKAASYGIGAGVELPLAESFGIVTGLDYVQRRFELGYDAARVERTVPTMFVPVLLRAWLGDSFYVQGGVYASKGLGTVKDDYIVGDSTVFDFERSKRRGLDFGAAAGIGLNIAMFGKTGLYVQGQYLYGFTDSASNSSFSEKVRDLLVSTGVRIEL